jgi:exopolysaccharide biosynthesis polyprenyl glycosylphosphotransferase
MPALVQSVVEAPRPAARPQRSQQLLNQDLFRHALVRQHRQSDRFEEPFGLALVSLSPLPKAVSVWAQVIEGLTAAARPTDIVGWFEEGVVLGVIRSRVDMDAHETGVTLQTTVERELARRLSDASSGCFVRAEVYAPKAGASARPLVDVIEDPEETQHQVVRQALKRAVDIAGSATLLTLTSPIFLVIGALVKLTSPGPVFFRQERVGEHGKPFMMLKFRSMQVNAAHDIHQQFVSQFIQGGQKPDSAAKAPVFKIVADPRVTKIGHFLRRTSLDELPQFWNVLKGDMSLVGPRPPLPYEVKVYKQWHWRRVLDAKPGITGLWQVTGRSRTTFDEMVRLDLRYAKRQSIWVDLKILFATPLAVIMGKGAH